MAKDTQELELNARYEAEKAAMKDDSFMDQQKMFEDFTLLVSQTSAYLRKEDDPVRLTTVSHALDLLRDVVEREMEAFAHERRS